MTTKRINMLQGRSANGGLGLGLMTTAGNPWTVLASFGDELVNRALAVYADPPSSSLLNVFYSPDTGMLHADNGDTVSTGGAVTAAALAATFGDSGSLAVTVDQDGKAALQQNWDGTFNDPSVLSTTDLGAVVIRRDFNSMINRMLAVEAALAVNFSPSSLDHLTAWWRADSSVTAAAGKVSQWASKAAGSGAFSLYPAAGASSEPALVTSGGPNGQPYVSFDGASSILATGGTVSYGSTKDLTIFIVGRPTSAGSNGATQVLMEMSQAGDYNPNCLKISSYVSGGARKLSVVEIPSPGANAEYLEVASKLADWDLLEVRAYCSLPSNQVSLTSLVGSSTGASVSTSPWSDTNALFVGARGGPYNAAPVDIAEILIFSRILTTSEETLVKSYLSARYALSA